MFWVHIFTSWHVWMIQVCLYGRALLWMKYRFICFEAFPSIGQKIQKFTCDADLLYTCSLLYIIDIQTNYLIEIQKELIYLCCDTFSSVVSTVHSEISLWYWCFVYFFFIACYKYTNKLNKENVLFYFIYWFARSKQIYNWMSFVITIHIELRVK